MSARLASRESLDSLLTERFRQRPVAEWLRRLAEAGISAGPLNDIQQSLALPVVAERELLVAPEKLSWVGGMPLLRLPIDPDGSGVTTAPPKLGQHTAEVLREAGLDEAAIARLIRD
jgi:crotonobetainyl-CoA:carnitine CoA-transferase CaiB-like acyl-CoA transferase